MPGSVVRRYGAVRDVMGTGSAFHSRSNSAFNFRSTFLGTFAFSADSTGTQFASGTHEASDRAQICTH